MKTGQGLSINAMILLVLALIVLIVLVIIFTGKAGQFSKESASCTGKAGECIARTESCSIPAAFYSCPNPEQVCCLSR